MDPTLFFDGQTMKAAVIGCGSIGRRHIKIFKKLGVSISAYNRGIRRRLQAKKDFNIPVYDSITQMLSDETPDFVVIASPNSFHLTHIYQAIASDTHIFVEKPLSHNLTGLNKAVQEVKAKKLITHVGSNMRFHRGPIKVKQLLNDEVIGRPVSAHLWVSSYLPSWHPTEDYREMYSAKKELGGGVVMDSIHEIDLTHWLFGKPDVCAAFCQKTGALDIETEDTASMLFKYNHALVVSVHMDYLQKPMSRGIKIIGSQGWIKWEIQAETVLWQTLDSDVEKRIDLS